MTRFEKYRQIKAVNYSLLKQIIEGKVESIDEEKSYLTLGSLVDCKLTTPDLFDSMFATVGSIPGVKPKEIVDRIFDDFASNPDAQIVGLKALSVDYVIDLIEQYEYWPNIKSMETRLNRLYNDALDYYAERLLAQGKTVVDAAMIELADRIANSIKTGRFTSRFFYLPKEIKVHYQVIITGVSVSDVPGKCMIDILLENTSDNPVRIGSYMLPGKHLLPIDIKTMSGSTLSFSYQMRKYKYHVQGAYYKHLLGQWIARNKPEYKVADFMFIVESTTYVGKPLAYVLSRVDEQIGRWGATKTAGGYIPAINDTGIDPDYLALCTNIDVLGFEQAIMLYKWHVENDEWDYPMYVVEDDGLIITKVFE